MVLIVFKSPKAIFTYVSVIKTRSQNMLSFVYTIFTIQLNQWQHMLLPFISEFQL